MTVFIDMDEVMADTYGAHIEWYNRRQGGSLTREQCMGGEVWQQVPEHRERIWQHYFEPGFFRELEPIAHSQEVLRELVEKYQVYVASAAMQFPNSLIEKHQWLDEHFPFIHWRNRILLQLPDPTLRGSQLKVKLADFNVGKAADPDTYMNEEDRLGAGRAKPPRRRSLARAGASPAALVARPLPAREDRAH